VRCRRRSGRGPRGPVTRSSASPRPPQHAGSGRRRGGPRRLGRTRCGLRRRGESRIPAPPDGLTDSKRLTPQRRADLAAKLPGWVGYYAIGEASHEETDMPGMTVALRRAAVSALQQLPTRTPMRCCSTGRTTASAGRGRCGARSRNSNTACNTRGRPLPPGKRSGRRHPVGTHRASRLPTVPSPHNTPFGHILSSIKSTPAGVQLGGYTRV
jgi:hypothetical protein